MSEQVGERLSYKGEIITLNVDPLAQYLETRKDIVFGPMSTACWRGYTGTWEIKDNKLFLIHLKACIFTDPDTPKYERDLNYLFPDQEIVFADWFTGQISIPMGEILKAPFKIPPIDETKKVIRLEVFVKRGDPGFIFEKDLILEFKDGVIVSEKVIDNRDEFQKKQLEN